MNEAKAVTWPSFSFLGLSETFAPSLAHVRHSARDLQISAEIHNPVMASELPRHCIEHGPHMIRSPQEEQLIDQLDCHVQNCQHTMHCLTASGSGESLDELFGNCMPRLFRVADCVLHNADDSEDALQDGLLSALRHLDQFKGNSQFSTWMYSIIRNSALAKLRKQRSHPMVSLDDQGSEDEPELSAWEIPADPGPDPERACAQTEN